MFFRFTVCERHPESHSCTGLFTVAYDLRDSGELASDDLAEVQEIIDWFKENLPIPACFDRLENPRAICWFKAAAGEPLSRIWRLVSFLKDRGIAVRVHKTRDPGQRLYSDLYQVVAVPQGKARHRTMWQ